MIIKARSRSGGLALATYLLRETEAEKAYVIDTRGTLSEDLDTVLLAWELEARSTTKGEKPLYHLFTRLAPGETLKESQWFKTLDRVEELLKLTDHPRAVVAHELNGQVHVHAVYSRLDYERGILRNMGNDRYAHHKTAREMEKEFGLREIDSTPRRNRKGNEKTRSSEHRMAKEAGTSRETLCKLMMAAWTASRTGLEFQRNIERLGMTMTRGDSRDYNVWHKGKRYDPVRLLETVKTAEFRAKMAIERPIIRDTDRGVADAELARRKAQTLTRDQLDLPHAETPPTSHEPTRAQARNLSAEELKKVLHTEKPALQKARPKRPRKSRGMTPRLRPKLWYGDPGI